MCRALIVRDGSLTGVFKPEDADGGGDRPRLRRAGRKSLPGKKGTDENCSLSNCDEDGPFKVALGAGLKRGSYRAGPDGGERQADDSRI